MIRRGSLPNGAAARIAAVVSLALLAGGERALAQEPPATARAVEKLEHERELEILRGDLERAREAEAALRAEIDSIKDDHALLTRTLIDTAGRIRDSETRLNAIQARLATLDARETAIRATLESRREALAAALSAMARLARRPTPALVLRPDEALDSVRAAMLLGAVVPELHGEAGALAADLAELDRIRAETTEEHEALGRQSATHEAERRRLNALVEERQRQQAAREKVLASERSRAAALARQVATVADLVSRIEREIEGAVRAAEAARRHADSKTALAALSDPARITPAGPFAEAKGRLPLPIAGTIVRAYGAADERGRPEQGIWLSTRPGGQVIAPCDGWVVYAGVFRSYGHLLIINAGGGYHVLLAGMEEIAVQLGQFVLTGEPVAVMGNGSGSAPASAASPSSPKLYIEFRKDGRSIDPGPWWTETETKKARG